MTLSPARYLRLVLLTALLLVGLVALVNYAADPFGIYHYGRRWDWIQSRPYLENFEGMHKAYEVTREKPDVLFLGDSHIEEGLDPRAPGVPPRAYNLATVGATLYQNLRYLQHAAAAHVPQVVVLGVDLHLFRPGNDVTPEFREGRMLVQADGRPTQFRGAGDWAPTLLSPTALRYSLETLFAPKTPAMTFADGYRSREGEPMPTARIAALNAALGAERAEDETPKFSMELFRRIVELCARDRIRLIVFVLPAHALELDHQMENWDNYCAWMQGMLETMEAEPRLAGEFWDFAGYNAMSTSAFTPLTERYSRNPYYWESVHFREGVGDLVLKRIFTGAGPSLFGRRVTGATLAQDEARLKTEREEWHRSGQVAPLGTDR